MSYLPLAKAIVLGVYEIASELLTERRKARARREAEKAVGLSHRDLEHQQAQIRSASRPASGVGSARVPKAEPKS